MYIYEGEQNIGAYLAFSRPLVRILNDFFDVYIQHMSAGILNNI